MSSSVPVVGATTLLKFGNGATPTEVFTTIPGVRTVPPPSKSRSYLEVTPIDYPLDSTQEITVPGEGAEYNFELNDLTGNTVQQEFLDIVDGEEECNMQVVYPNGRTIPFRLKFSGWDPMPAERKSELKLQIKAKVISRSASTIA
jgi:hypothetical protein